jgi:pimeloyl-ACP methyl ester carboxylesterase
MMRDPIWARTWKHQVGRLAACALAAYAGIILVLLSQEDRLLYGPRNATHWVNPPAAARVEDVEMTSRLGHRIHAWWAAPSDWQPEQGAVLFCHGNGCNLSPRGRGLLPWLEEMHLAVLLFDYPGFGKSSGEPSEEGCCAAGDAAYDWLTGVRKVPADRVLLYGGSLGGGIATDLAVRRPHRALVFVCSFTSFPDMAQAKFPWLPGRWLVRNRFDNLDKIGRCPGPVFIAHGTRDGLIPYEQGERLFAAAKEPKRFLSLVGFGHNDMPPAEFYPTLRHFLQACEKAPD